MIQQIMHILSSFFRWWLQGLSYLMPEKLRSLVISQPEHVVIEVDNKQFKITHIPNNPDIQSIVHTFDEDNELDKLSTLNWLNTLQQKKQVTISWLITERQVLKKNLCLPIAAKNTIRQVLGFEMDRCTPFKQEDVYYDHIVSNKNNVQDELQIELFVAKRTIIDSIIEKANNWKLQLDNISTKVNNERFNINFIPDKQRENTKQSGYRLTAILFITCCALGAANLYVPITQKQNRLEFIQSDLNQYRKEALLVQNIKQEKEALEQKAQFLFEKHKETTPPIQIINELTQIVPDHTWINRLILKNRELQLQGESDNASELIPLLEASSNFQNARFRSPTTTNRATQKERFQLIVSVSSINKENGK